VQRGILSLRVAKMSKEEFVDTTIKVKQNNKRFGIHARAGQGREVSDSAQGLPEPPERRAFETVCG
jgi:hypothetical protein